MSRVTSTWYTRKSIEQCFALHDLLKDTFKGYPLESELNIIGFSADREAILSLAERGHWSTVVMKLDLGQASLPRNEVEKLLNAIVLLG